MSDLPKQRVLVLGATGLTGSLVVEALEHRHHPYVLAGRDAKKLEAPASRLGNVTDVRIADVTRPETLRELFAGVDAVINTVGPFGLYGYPVVEAAIEQGVHYVDTSGEQSFQRGVYERYHRRAVGAAVTVVTGQAVEYAFSCLGLALLHQRCGPIAGANSYHLVEGFRPSRGTVQSALSALGEEFVCYRDGRLSEQSAQWRPRQVRLAGEQRSFNAVALPGGDVVMLPVDFPQLRYLACYGLLPAWPARAAALLISAQPALRRIFPRAAFDRLGAAIGARVRPPSPRERERASWTVFVEALAPGGVHLCRMAGKDVYASSAEVAALSAVWLAGGKGRDSGVMTAGRAFDPVEFLDALKPCGISWQLR